MGRPEAGSPRLFQVSGAPDISTRLILSEGTVGLACKAQSATTDHGANTCEAAQNEAAQHPGAQVFHAF